MSGSSHGITQHTFIGARVGTSSKNGSEIKMLYTPAHIRADGKPVSARLVVPILINEYGKTDPSSYRLVAWGALADLFAKNLSQGKEMNFICDGSSYWGNVFYNDGTQVMQKDGITPLQTRQTSFTIRSFTWGSDSNRTTDDEIAAGMQSGEGRRPAGWNIVGTPDNLTWKQMLAMRKQTFYMGGERYGYAKVVAPRSIGCNILTGDQSKILRTHAQPAVNTVPLVNQVANALPIQNVQVQTVNTVRQPTPLPAFPA
jgi:hypothetical protein